ncbi:hypothetical protein Tco_0487284 [Tanacetum coccineum]
MGTFATHPDEDTHKSKLLPEGTLIDPKDSRRNVQLADKGLPSTNSPSPYKDHLESSQANKYRKPKESPEPSDSESSSASLASKPFNNYMHHEEAAASYANLKWEIEDFHDIAFRAASNTDANLRNFEQILNKDKAQHVEGINKILTNLKEVQDAVKKDHVLNKKVIEVVEAYIKNSLSLTKLPTLVKDFDYPGFKSTVESLQATVTTQNDHRAKWAESSTSTHTASISPFVPSPESSPERKAEEKKETPSRPEGEQSDMVTEKHKENKVTEEDPQVTQPEPIQIIISTTPYPTIVITPEDQVTELTAQPITEVGELTKERGLQLEMNPHHQS